jgi:hypothetical protein
MTRSTSAGLGLVLAAAISGTAAGTASAQAALSTQGFGFPTGQLSARSYGTGGSIAEIDPLSPVNPATLTMIGTRLINFQIEPEYRSVSASGGIDRTTTARYPVVFGAIPIKSWVMSLGASTLLDRTSTTIFPSTQPINGGERVETTQRERVDGAMDDVRFGAGWMPANWLRVGLGVHGIVGHNLIDITRSFTDSTQFATFSEQRLFGFSGFAASAGVELISRLFMAGVSYRQGGNIQMSSQDTVVTKARVPNHFGASLAYTGITNSSIAVRIAHDGWSSLGALGGPGFNAVSGWDNSIGADMAGPRMLGRSVFLRGGFRYRTLPFQADSNTVTEKSVTAGAGTTFANQRVLADIALIRAVRTANLPATEKAWTISIGLSIRP